jgi:hypothetical protein
VSEKSLPEKNTQIKCGYVVVPYEPFFCQNIYIKMAFSALFYWKNTIKGMIKIARFCKIFQKALQSMRKIRTIQSQYSK